MTAVEVRPMEAQLTDALAGVGLHVRSVHAWHEEPTYWKGRRLRADQWHFEVRVAEDMGRYFAGCHYTGWIDEEAMAVWFAERVGEMVPEPGSYSRGGSGETQQPDGSWAFTEPGRAFGANFELSRIQRRQTGRRKP